MIDDVNIDDYIAKLTLKLQTINNLREELIKLELDPRGRLYFNNDVLPLLTTLYQLSSTSVNLATSVSFLSDSRVVHSKDSKLKDTISLIYKINEQCEDIYKELNISIKELLKIVSC